MIHLLPTFHGLENENLYVHIREFEEVVATFRDQTQTLDVVRLRFFSFSLKDRAKVWLYSLRPRSITTWDDMNKAFFHKLYSNHKAQKIKKQISTFTQKAGETSHQVCEGYKDLLNLCPHHGYGIWRIVNYFYDGLSYEELKFIEMMCSGGFLQKSPEEAFEFLEEATEKSHQ